jgi:phosphodiesterase/alkaline phosphatase D-like protein
MAGMRRRRFLSSAAALVAAPLSGLDVIAAARRSPAMIPRALQEWELPSGVQVGDVTDTRAMIWSAAGREAREGCCCLRSQRNPGLEQHSTLGALLTGDGQ